MQHPSQATFSREDFLAFFNDNKVTNLLSAEDKAEIASKLIAKDQKSIQYLLNKLMDDSGKSIQQIVQERNSLPVF